MKIEQCHWGKGTDAHGLPANSELGAKAQVVFAFGSAEVYKTRGCFDTLKKRYPKAHIIGCSSGGAIQDTRVLDDNIVATALHFEYSTVAAVKEEVANVEDSFAAGQRLLDRLPKRGLKHVLVLSDGLKVNGSDLVAGVSARVPEGVTFSGGFAADGDNLAKTCVWLDGQPEESAVVCLGFYGERLRVGVCATGGWGPFGPDRLITKSRKNVLFEFDGRPALEVYKNYLGDYASGLPATGLMFPLDLRVGTDSHRVLRALLSIDEKEQSITFAGNVPEGAYARFMMGHVDELVGHSQDAAKSSAGQLNGNEPPFALLVSCNARRAVLKQRVEEEVEAIRETLPGSTAFTGFYSYGEIAPPEAGGTSVLHNETMVVISFAET